MTRGPWRRWRRSLALCYFLLIAAVSYSYFSRLSANLVLGALALLYTPASDDKPHTGFRYGGAAIAFIVLFFFAPLKTFVYAALACAFFCYRESFFRRIPVATLIILALLTPMANYFANTFSFPIRLRLTSIAGSLITLTGSPAHVEGNTIGFRDHLFSVDPACMGLNMLVVSLIAALLLMNYYQRLHQRQLPVLVIILVLLLTTTLNIIANLLRMVCLVVLLILPENPLHGIFGLLMLGVYVLLPLLPMIRFAIHRFGHPVLPANGSTAIVRSRWMLAGNIVVTAGVLLITGLALFKKEQPQPQTATPIPGYTERQLANGILQLDNSRAMVYIKHIPGFYCTDHTPSICWEGSGYTFTTLRVSTVAGFPVFEGCLEKDREKLYTAWWYDNGEVQTVNPLDWRWDWIRGGAPYAVINVTTSTSTQLAAEIAYIRRAHPFDPLLNRPHR